MASDRLRIHGWQYGVLLLILICAGCLGVTTTVQPSPTATATATFTPSPTTEPTATPSATPSPTSTPRVTMHDAGTRTGLEDVDRIIDVTLAGDIDRLRDALTFITVGCTHEQGLGGPPKCRDGEREGCNVDVFPFFGPEGHFLRKDKRDTWSGVDVAGLYAVYRVSEAVFSDTYYPAGEVGIIFVGGRGEHIALHVTDGGVVRIDFVGESPLGKLEREAREIVLPPPSRSD